MLTEALRSLEDRCAREAPALLDEVRHLSRLATLSSLGATLDLEPVSLDGPVASSAPASSTPTALGDRYADLGRIGMGGMGEVRRVRDRELNRVVALKRVRSDIGVSDSTLARFVEEVQTTAQLQHPGIVPVYDCGRTPDGQLYFTMKEVRGRTLNAIIQEMHGARAERPRPEDWSLRRLVTALHQASQAVAYAHERGVVHRDLKPENIMLGDHGEVQVMDWGLSKVLGRAERTAEGVAIDRARDATQVGRVLGTPTYMAPEQARGDVEAVDARTDVYALGAILYEVLSGRTPYDGRSTDEVLSQILSGPPAPPTLRFGSGAGSEAMTWMGDFLDFPEPTSEVPAPPIARGDAEAEELPEDLVTLCMTALAHDPDQRPDSAAAFASELEAWLDGSRRRERALEVVQRAEATVPEAEALRERAAALRAEAQTELGSIAPWAPEDRKLEAWAKQDHAAELEAQAALKALHRDQLLAASLTHVPELPEAHAALAEDQRARHADAEAARDTMAAVRAEVLLRSHTEALPVAHPTRQRCAAYLKGTGALTLITDPQGAEVDLLRFEPYGRRLVPRPVRSLGRTPLVEVPLEMGSYVLHLRLPGRALVRYPVHIGRGEHWHGVRPGDGAPFPVELPRREALGPDDCYIPAGWYQLGATRDYGALPPQRLWCHPFVLRRFPVTQAQYIAFLNDLVAQGREEEALRYAPRDADNVESGMAPSYYGRDADGRFVLTRDADGMLWLPDWPAFKVDWDCAVAYARWQGERSGLAWRLPWDLEWEKAARGVDGRIFPWGDSADPSYCSMGESHAEGEVPDVIHAFPVDESPYGVRGLGGNTQDWCADKWFKCGPPRPDGVVTLYDPPQIEGELRRVRRGGAWNGPMGVSRVAYREGERPAARYGGLGIRLARPWP